MKQTLIVFKNTGRFNNNIREELKRIIEGFCNDFGLHEEVFNLLCYVAKMKYGGEAFDYRKKHIFVEVELDIFLRDSIKRDIEIWNTLPYVEKVRFMGTFAFVSTLPGTGVFFYDFFQIYTSIIKTTSFKSFFENYPPDHPYNLGLRVLDAYGVAHLFLTYDGLFKIKEEIKRYFKNLNL